MKANEYTMGVLSAIYTITCAMELSGVLLQIPPAMRLPLKQFTDEFRRVTEAELQAWKKQQAESN